jgi:saccharopine dehydrogenase-like NADP-dependent oxidoreductase
MNAKILVIGSNGILGKHIVAKVIQSFGVNSLVLSDYKRKRLAWQKEQIHKEHGEQPATKIIDVNSADSIRNGLNGIDLAIIALQQKEPLIQRQCMEKNAHSIDLSVDPGFLEKVLALPSTARTQNVQLITGGLFPGLSGILAREIHWEAHPKKPVDIGLLQSTNGTNGKTGVSDMLQIFDQDVAYHGPDSTRKYPGFSFKKQFSYPAPFGEKKLRLANFIERDYLQREGIRANYWTAFDKESFNSLISILKKIGFLKLFGNPKFSKTVSPLITKEKPKKENEYIGLSAKSPGREISMVLSSDYEATAACALAFAQKLLSMERKHRGVKFPFELFSFAELKPALEGVIKKLQVNIA